MTSKNGVGVMKMRTDRKGVCPWCLEQMVRLCLCAFWGHPLGIGALFEHSFRGPRQISELCSSPPSGPGQQLTSMCTHVYTIEIVTEVWVSKAIVSIRGKRTAFALMLRLLSRPYFLIAASYAGFQNVYFKIFLPFHALVATINHRQLCFGLPADWT